MAPASKHEIDRQEDKPQALEVCPASIPEELRGCPQWVGWRYCRRESRWAKVPLAPPTGQQASVTDPATWGTFAAVLAWYQDRTSDLDGIGFVFTAEDPYCGVDLDDAYDGDAVKVWAQNAVVDLESYTEVSPSRTGLKIFVRARKPGPRCRAVFNGGAVEIYDRARFFAVTGRVLPEWPAIETRQESLTSVYQVFFTQPAWLAPEGTGGQEGGERFNDGKVIDRAGASADGELFARLWRGDTAAHQGDHSAADLALCNLLRFWCRADMAQVDRLFRQSALMRRKWDEKRGAQTYGQLTLARARAGPVYDPRYRYSPGAMAASTPGHHPGQAVPPFTPFPTECFTPIVARFVAEAATTLGVDESFVALPVLSVLASAIGNSRRVRIKNKWIEPPIVWTAILGDSGSGKSPALDLAIAGHQAREQRYRAEHRAARQRYEDDLERWKKLQRQRDEASASPPRPRPPVCRRVLLDDLTLDALPPLLEDNPRGLLIACDELATWLGSFGRFKGRGAQGDRAGWLSLHKGRAFSVDRKTGERPALYVPESCVSITGGIQPDILRRGLAPEDWSSGLVARFLFALPPWRPRQWTDSEIGQQTQHQWDTLLGQLFALPCASGQGKNTPVVLDLSDDGRDLYAEFVNRWGVARQGVAADRAAALAKLEFAAARLALVHHCCWAVERGVSDLTAVDRISVVMGIGLAEWFAGETERVYQILAQTPGEQEQQRLVELIQRKGGQMSGRELQRANTRKYRTAAQAEADLAGLVAAGLARWQEMQGPGRPWRTCVLEGQAGDCGEDPQA